MYLRATETTSRRLDSAADVTQVDGSRGVRHQLFGFEGGCTQDVSADDDFLFLLGRLRADGGRGSPGEWSRSAVFFVLSLDELETGLLQGLANLLKVNRLIVDYCTRDVFQSHVPSLTGPEK